MENLFFLAGVHVQGEHKPTVVDFFHAKRHNPPNGIANRHSNAFVKSYFATEMDAATQLAFESIFGDAIRCKAVELKHHIEGKSLQELLGGMVHRQLFYSRSLRYQQPQQQEEYDNDVVPGGAAPDDMENNLDYDDDGFGDFGDDDDNDNYSISQTFQTDEPEDCLPRGTQEDSDDDNDEKECPGDTKLPHEGVGDFGADDDDDDDSDNSSVDPTFQAGDPQDGLLSETQKDSDDEKNLQMTLKRKEMDG